MVEESLCKNHMAVVKDLSPGRDYNLYTSCTAQGPAYIHAPKQRVMFTAMLQMFPNYKLKETSEYAQT